MGEPEALCHQDPLCLRPRPQLGAEPASVCQHLAALWALDELPLLPCPRRGRMEPYLHVMSAAVPGGGAGWQALLPKGLLVGSFLLEGSPECPGTTAKQVDGARVLCKCAILGQFLGQNKQN